MTYLASSRRAALIASLIRMSTVSRLDEVTAMIWRAHAAGEIADQEAQNLAQMVENARGRRPWQRADREAIDDVGPKPRRPFIR